MTSSEPESALGFVVRGSLADGIEMKLAADRSVEEVRAGRFVVVDGGAYRFFSMITDVSLNATAPEFLLHPPPPDRELHKRILAGTSTFGTVKLRPMLMLSRSDDGELLPVKTIPTHFSQVSDATAGDVGRVFGREGDAGYFKIGAPLDMGETPVCLDMKRFVERSNGIFGKSGTGKTFLTRICLCGIVRENAAVNLVFDMHSEYGWQGATEDPNRESVRGLKQYFQKRVAVYTLDPASSKRRGVKIENQVLVPLAQVTIEDIALLQNELNLNPTAVETAYLLADYFGADWISGLLETEREDLAEICEKVNAHPAAVFALRRKLHHLTSACREFLRKEVKDEDDAVPSILANLDAGRHVVLEFGGHNRPLQYMLVANILTRRIHEAYVRKTEESLGGKSAKPRPLVITIEEAHKFLAPGLSNQTIFGTIAREMRKFGVTLLIVDQRPSGIDDEVLSQVGTKLICLLDDERDIQAVLSGTPNAAGLRGVLASLETKQQALLVGHAVPMPVVVRTRTYDDAGFAMDMRYEEPSARDARLEQDKLLDFPS